MRLRRFVVWAIKLLQTDFRRSLRARIFLFLAGVLAVGAVILGYLAWLSASDAAKEAYDKLLSSGAVQIAENVFVQGGVVTLDPPVSTIGSLSAYDLVFYKVVDPRGVVVAGYEDLISSSSPESTRRGLVLEDGTYQGQKVRIATISKQIETSGTSGWATVILAQTINARTSLANDLTTKALIVVGVMSIVAVAVTMLAVHFALRPLAAIEREIAAREPDDLSPIQARSPVEIQNLVQAIDDFMRRLADRISIFQRFIADAAHQMRTPLAALDAQVEMLSNAKSIDDSADATSRVRERSAELGRLTSQLLDHAMILHRADTSQYESVNLNELAKSVLSKAVPLSLTREIEISFIPAPSDPIVKVDMVSLREALSNVIDNALVHGARTRLTVSVLGSPMGGSVMVCDDGDGFEIDPSHLIAPFEKGSRSAGSGLGLAIASEVARAHAGSLIFSRENGLTCVEFCVSGSRKEHRQSHYGA